MVNRFTDTRHLREHQYSSPDNLMARADLYERFAVGRSLQDDRVDALGDLSNESVIDFGCGNAMVWVRAKDRNVLPVQLCLVDLSAGMLQAATENLHPFVPTCLEHDLMLPLSDIGAFDTITAFHMLYHLSDPRRGMDNMLACLRTGGRGFVHLNAPGHLAGILELINEFEDSEVFSEASVAGSILPDEAARYWQDSFVDIRKVDCSKALHVTDPVPLLDYIMSTEALHGNRYETPQVQARLESFLSERVTMAIKDAGHLLITSHSVLLKFEDKF